MSRSGAPGPASEVIAGHAPGPTLWVWVPAGSKSPSLVQAAAEVRDALDPARLRGRVGFLFDGPILSDTRGGESGGRARALRTLVAGALAVVALVEGPHEEARRVELDVDDEAARHAARATGVGLWIKTSALPVLGVPLLLYRDGAGGERSPTVSRPVVAAARRALESLLVGARLAPGRPPRARVRVIVKTVLAVERGDAAGSAETCVYAGQVVRRGDPLALVGRPGAQREAIVAPSSGVVLSVDRSTGGPLLLLGKLERALAAAERAFPPRSAVDGKRRIGWCEWVGLPDLGVSRIKAKVDTGARSCALHVAALALHLVAPARSAGEGSLVEIEIPSGRGSVTATCRVVDYATVRDSGGHVERRPVIRTTLDLGGQTRSVRITLTDRGDMLFPMLIGRAALGDSHLVDPAVPFLLGKSGGAPRHPKGDID